ncbi:DUF5615 family PIN-like protein [Luteolibacter arcticus]|uniref:DUF5615 family PIN-like protein n=1 Tax=Luteolibacter arcticus TaxID=1581411 RepID=A0ABT3GMY0_9BACT|nr:DUF5615 family PIN-like protein [Luteolibacter arcticus]MCW1924870.1 DUF5615 family PIN-like protein [Luteolibacter arcticus]
MTLAYYMDVHVPKSVAVALRKRGIDVLTAQDDGTTTLDDESLLLRATGLGRVLVSQDTDLLRIANDFHVTGRSFSGLVFAAQTAVAIGAMVGDLEVIAAAATPADMRDTICFLPL